MRDGSLNGSRRRNRSLTKLKIAVFNPMPSTSVRTATKVNPGDLRSWRKANLRSFIDHVRLGLDRCTSRARRQKTRGQRDGNHDHECESEGQWVARTDFVKKIAH